MNGGDKSVNGDPFILNYDAGELRIASEFLRNWLPFLSRGLCQNCTEILSDRIRSLDLDRSGNGDSSGIAEEGEKSAVLTPDMIGKCLEGDNCCTGSIGDGKGVADSNDTTDTHSLGSWKDEAEQLIEPVTEAWPISEANGTLTFPNSPRAKMSWADMAQEDELEIEEENEVTSKFLKGSESMERGSTPEEDKPKVELSREQREYIRFSSVKRKKDFICLERINGKIVNILDGLELHTGVFSNAEQKRIVNCIEGLQQKGKNGQLKERTYSAPQRWMRGKGRVTLQFGCCYNYATDKKGNPPGILKNEIVDPLPHLLKVMIKRLVSWHVLPPSCVPDSCIVNIYEEGDCIPPHIDNHDFVRPFCTVSFLSECKILFGSNLKIVGAGEFQGAFELPLPVGSVLVLNGNGASVAKHCVPAVPAKRISITFRKMDKTKWPIGHVPEPDLEGLQPLPYEVDRPKRSRYPIKRQQSFGRENIDRAKGSSSGHRDYYYSGRNRMGRGSG